ncbi:MAG: ATP-binding cassette domain-containing protein [Dysgonamonadaceae bacterium]|jgi:ABC-2 type transport system ATP-binding protein|nr:ATP-binding cassette domain-containing protein [Dysgonamonadaceae bacterium]
MSYAIEVKNLSKSFYSRKKQGFWAGIFARKYNEKKAVNKLSFTIKEGERVAFIGPNGAGKSTTIKMLTSILHPTSGRARVMGMNPAEDRELLAYNIGAVFGQRSQLWQHLSPMKSFELLAAVYDIPESTFKKRLKNLVATFEIGEYIDKPVRTFSLGERMRCEIVASLLHNPKVLFLDEPTIGLDVVAKAKIRETLKELNRREGTTIILTSHDAGDIEDVCNRAIIINHGKIVIDESITKLKAQYLSRKVIRATGARGKISVYEIDTKCMPLQAALADIIKKDDLVDLTIEDPSMEEIIKDVYSKSENISCSIKLRGK